MRARLFIVLTLVACITGIAQGQTFFGGASQSATNAAATVVVGSVQTVTPTAPTPPIDPVMNVSLAPAKVLIFKDPKWSSSANTVTKSRSGSFPARLVNVSVRGMVSSGSDVSGGAVITGTGSLPTLVRAVGGTLRQFGVNNALLSPSLTVYRGSEIAAQTNYTESTVAAAAPFVGAFPTQLGNDTSTYMSDAGLLGQPLAGSLSAHCGTDTSAGGIALVEFYDASSAPTATSPRFQNFSAQARVDTGEALLIVGFVVAGDGNITLLLRGVGPTLSQFGVSGALADPQIELYSGSTKIAASDNWRTETHGSNVLADTATQVGAFALSDDNEAALIVKLAAGNYSLQLRGVGNGTGTALAEIYEVR
jgi:hypothetical protein